jgi:hypothetical protein
MMVLAMIASAPAQNKSATNIVATVNIAALPAAPPILPGSGLAQHDFFYAGESKAQRMYIVRGGQIVWE